VSLGGIDTPDNGKSIRPYNYASNDSTVQYTARWRKQTVDGLLPLVTLPLRRNVQHVQCTYKHKHTLYNSSAWTCLSVLQYWHY